MRSRAILDYDLDVWKGGEEEEEKRKQRKKYPLSLIRFHSQTAREVRFWGEVKAKATFRGYRCVIVGIFATNSITSDPRAEPSLFAVIAFILDA